MALIWIKIILALCMVIITFVAGIAPVKLLKILRKTAASAATSAKQRSVSLVLCLLTCFSGGVFLSTCFLHLFPELYDHFNQMKKEYSWAVSYPVAELLSCVGFFLLFLLEETILLLVPGLAHSHGPPTAHQFSVDREQDTEHCYRESLLATGGVSLDAWNDNTASALNGTKCDAKDEQKDDASKTVEMCGCSPSLQNRPQPMAQYGGSSCAECALRPPRTLTLAEPEACETNCEAVKEDPPILMASSPHAHSHGIRSVTFVLAISFHSIIEGLAFGVQESAGEVWALFISLMVHKVIVAFSVGLQLARTHAHALGWVCCSVLLFASMSPLGAAAGMFVQNAQIDSQLRDLIVLVFQGLAVGTFIYVTFFEVLLHERDNEHPNLLKLLFMLFGFALIGSLRMVDVHSHAHRSHTDQDVHVH